MRTKLSVRAENFQPQPARRIIRSLLAAALGLAITFTLSCSSDDGDGSGGQSSSVAPSSVPSSSSVAASSSSVELSSSSTAESSSDGNNPGQIQSLNKFEAKPASEIGNDKIKYSYSYGGYDFYYIYLGELKNIPLFGYPTEYHDGTKTTYMVSNTETIKESVSETITNSSQIAIGVVEEHTYSTTNRQKVSAEVKVNTGWGPVKAEAKATAEASWEQYISDSKTTSFHKTTSLTNTITKGTEYTKTTLISRSWELDKDNKVGYYKYTLFSASDVYIYVIKDATGVIYYEFREHVIPDVYFWRFDYSETPSFRKSDATGFEFDVSMLDNLPKPDISLSLVLPPPPPPPVLVEKTEAMFNSTDVGSYTYTFDKNFPATIEIYALGAGGGGQGGHFSDLMGGGYGGTGAAGGGGGAAYAKFTIEQPTTFNIKIGRGGNGGTAEFVNWVTDWRSGNPGENGENTTVTWGANTIAAKGGNGGGGSGQNLSGGSGGEISSKPAVVSAENWSTAAGQQGTGGTRDGNIASVGGNAGEITGKGSVASFGGGKGGVKDGKNVETGGGGSSRYGRDQSGSAGGDGQVIIVVTYIEE